MPALTAREENHFRFIHMSVPGTTRRLYKKSLLSLSLRRIRSSSASVREITTTGSPDQWTYLMASSATSIRLRRRFTANHSQTHKARKRLPACPLG
jgi:hypothetical protein